MPISQNSPLSSSVANSTWLDKTEDDETIGKFGLNNADAESGEAIANAQQAINEASIFASNTILSLPNGGQIALDGISKVQYIRVEGDGIPVTLNRDVFTTAPKNLTKIYLVGTDSTNPVTLLGVSQPSEDVSGSLFLNGNATLERGWVIELIYDQLLDRYLEIGRNF